MVAGMAASLRWRGTHTLSDSLHYAFTGKLLWAGETQELLKEPIVPLMFMAGPR